MKKTSIIFIFLGLILGALCYVSTNNIVFGALTSFIFVVDYFLFMSKRFKHYTSLIERIHTSYHFINSFIITLSVKDSFEDAYQNGIRINNARLNAETDQLKEMPVLDRAKYLKDYFNLSIYLMFLNVINLYQDQGGNILTMSDNLLKECTRAEKTLSDTIAIGNKHLKEFITLWVMSIGILIFMRFSLNEFYAMMLKEKLFGILIFVFFLICILSVNLFIIVFSDLTVKEATKHVKKN